MRPVAGVGVGVHGLRDEQQAGRASASVSRSASTVPETSNRRGSMRPVACCPSACSALPGCHPLPNWLRLPSPVSASASTVPETSNRPGSMRPPSQVSVSA